MPERPVTRGDLWEAQAHVESTVKRGNRVRLGFLLGFLLGVVLVVVQVNSTRERLQEGCERQNVRTTQQIGFIQDAKIAWQGVIDADGSSTQAHNAQATLDRYTARAQGTKPPADLRVDGHPRHTDCAEAYPPAWPLSWFE